MKQKNQTLYDLLRSAGHKPVGLAKAVGVSKSTVNFWNTRRIPAERVSEISRITGIPREALRPDIYVNGGAK